MSDPNATAAVADPAALVVDLIELAYAMRASFGVMIISPRSERDEAKEADAAACAAFQSKALELITAVLR
jgi:hypothetical protein